MKWHALKFKTNGQVAVAERQAALASILGIEYLSALFMT